MLPRISNLIDVRDFILLLYEDEKNNTNYYKNTNYIFTKGRGYLKDRERILQYFSQKWKPKVMEKHFFHALNLLGISLSIEDNWIINMMLLKEFSKITDGLQSNLNDLEIDLFRKLLFDTNFRSNLVLEFEGDKSLYINRWSKIYNEVFFQGDETLNLKITENKIPFEKYNSIKKISLVSLSYIKEVLKKELSQNNEKVSVNTVDREASTFTTWNYQLKLIEDVPKMVTTKILNFTDVLYHEISLSNSDMKFDDAIKSMYNYLKLRNRKMTVLIYALKGLVKIVLSLPFNQMTEYFNRYVEKNRPFITVSPTSPAYFDKDEWDLLTKWIYRDKKSYYLTIEINNEVFTNG